MSIYNYKVNKPNGELISLSEYKGKPILIINTATQCGLTPQFEGLEKLHQDYKDKGLVVLGFPCNQFGGQEPLKNEDMEETCLINHGVTFPLMEKIKVNGKDAHPLFKYLKKTARSGFFINRIKWNFEKFLINSNGIPIKRYSPTTKPNKLVDDIVEEINITSI